MRLKQILQNKTSIIPALNPRPRFSYSSDMNAKKHHGTVVLWFDDMHRGTILSDHNDQRIFAGGESLAADYQQPQEGDRVSFDLDEDTIPPSAANIRRLDEAPRPAASVRIQEWDLMQNAGFGTLLDDRSRPVFVLGQFLTDQGRVPEIGDHLEGTLHQHSNGQWMLVDATITGSSDNIQPEPDAPQPERPEPVRPAPKTGNSANFLQPNQVMSGRITNWNDEKGYGFIRFGDPHQNVFFHINAFHYRRKRPQSGQSVSFYCNHAAEGQRQQAIRVVLHGDEAHLFDNRPADDTQNDFDMPNLLLICLIGLAYLAAVAWFSYKLAAVYLIAGIVAFVLYRTDKAIARTSRRRDGYIGRVPEKNLHLAALVGGWPGAWLARHLFRHKTSKRSFVAVFWLTVAINIAITYALLIHYAHHPLVSLLNNPTAF